MRRVVAVFACVLALATTAQAHAADPLRAGAEAVRDKALADPTAYEIVRSLTTEVGPRVAGTEASARARDWGMAKLKALGFSNVRAEAIPMTVWIRGRERAAVTAPYAQPLSIIGLARSVPTPTEGIEADVALFRTYADLIAQPPGSLTGKIAVVTQPMVRTQDGMGYGLVNPLRRSGPSEAARRGAVAYLHRSLSTADDRNPHTGALNYADDAPRIPAAALAPADAMLLERMAESGKPIRIRLSLASATRPTTSWTVLGDIPGREKPGERIMVGGHLDSWDPGVGAIDDGAGVAIITAAARLAGEARPRRTITAVMWGAEETDDSGIAFTAAHTAEAASLVMIGSADSGADRAWSVQLPAGAAAKPQMRAYAATIAPLKAFIALEPSTRGSSDTGGLVRAGVPSVSVRQDVTRYFDWHHSAEDTLDKIDPAQLRQAVAVWASLVFIVANSDVDFRPAPAAAAP